MSGHLEVKNTSHSHHHPPSFTECGLTPLLASPPLIHRVWFDAAVGLLARKEDESRSSVDAELVKRRSRDGESALGGGDTLAVARQGDPVEVIPVLP